jgi:hypothetical protein
MLVYQRVCSSIGYGYKYGFRVYQTDDTTVYQKIALCDWNSSISTMAPYQARIHHEFIIDPGLTAICITNRLDRQVDHP